MSSLLIGSESVCDMKKLGQIQLKNTYEAKAILTQLGRELLHARDLIRTNNNMDAVGDLTMASIRIQAAIASLQVQINHSKGVKHD